MFLGRNKLTLCAVFSLFIFLGNIENAGAVGVCTPVNPTVTIAPATQSGVEEGTLTYTLTVVNNDVLPCASRSFALALSGLPAAATCAEGVWVNNLPASTGLIAPGATYTNNNVKITSCRGPYAVGSSFTFTITATQGGDSGNDSAVYVINASSSEICDNGVNDDGDAAVDCADSDCLGDPACCGNSIIEGSETCDGLTNCALPNLCSVSCNACNAPLPPPPSGPCTPLGKIGGLVPCGRVLNDPATSWNETAPCNLCHIVPTIYNIIGYLIGIVGIFTIFFIVIGMLMSISSVGGPGGLATIKTVISKSIFGFVAVLVAWLIVNLCMTLFGFNDPLGDNSWRKIDCNLDTSFCGDGIVNGTEVCEPGVSADLDCETTLGVGPAYCATVAVAGKRSCNCTCDGWNDCAALSPTPTDSSSSACDSTSPAMNDYACCELTSCGLDGCGCCGRGWGAATPGGYTTVFTSAACSGSCKMNRSNANPRDWMITTEHTTANFRCWK